VGIKYNIEDYIGRKYNHLTILGLGEKDKRNVQMWKCECDLCHRHKSFYPSQILHYDIKTCGCNKGLGKIDKTIQGKKIGKLTVLRFLRIENHQAIWECECSCDKHTHDLLQQENVKSCGCWYEDNHNWSYEDLTGNIYGSLQAVSSFSKNKKTYWNCKCVNCGTEWVVQATKLKNRKTNYCKKCRLNVNTHKREIYNTWQVQDRYYIKNGKYYWLCKCLECGKEEYKRLGSIGKCTCQIKTHYPQWFIDELAHEEDKQRAISGYLRSSDKVDFICKTHGIYNQLVNVHIKISTQERRSGCPQCKDKLAHYGSKNELKIKKFIENISNKKFEKKIILGRKEIDMYNDELKLGIEYNGSAYHATEHALYDNKDKYYHRDKFLQAKKQGIHLITIFDKDYEENKYLILDRLYHIIQDKDKRFILPTKDIEYTNNDYDLGEYMKDFGYEEIGQEEPTSFIYGDKFVVYRCGRTIWKKKYKSGD